MNDRGAKPPCPNAKGVSKINGRVPINSKYAGQPYPSIKLSPQSQAKYPDGVKFNAQGFPDFSQYAKAEVKLDDLTGDYRTDEALANEAVNLSKTPENYTWHHVEDGVNMQLVPTNLHQGVRHTGGSALITGGR